MQTTFTDLVGTAAMPAHCFDMDELTELAPVLEAATTDHDMGPEACEGSAAHPTAHRCYTGVASTC